MGTRTFVVKGRVQGVGFRWWCRAAAQRLGLSGWVRNRPDGTVEVVAVGPAEALHELSELLGQGPPAAMVREVATESGPEDVPVREFEIRR